MKQKLYGNTKNLAKIFVISIIVVTIIILALRLSVFKDKASNSNVSIFQTTNKYITYSLNENIYFESLTANGDLLINSDIKNIYKFTVTISNATIKDPLIFTGFISPGESIENLPFDNADNLPLDDGSYPCTATIKIYDSDSLKLVDSVKQDVRITIGTKTDE